MKKIGPEVTGLPQNGMSLDKIIATLREYKSHDPILRFNGNAMKGNMDVQQVSKEAASEFFLYNALYSVLVPSLGRIEDELIDMCVGIFNGDKDVRANLTLGGTDSIFCALHAMREQAKITRGVNQPNLVVPYSAHAAFTRSAHYLGVKLRRTPLQKNFRADVTAMEAAIDDQTIGLVASAPCWPYGLFDPIKEIGDLALKTNLWLHVDACLGGYLTPFVRKAGFDLPDFDFMLPGVASISADLHKYGFAPKPISTILWRSEEQQQYHFTLADDWPSGIYFTHSFAGSRPAGPAVAAWAILKYLGEEGKIRLARRTMEVKQRLHDGIAEIDGLVPFKNDLTPFLFSTDKYDIGQIVGGMGLRGWLTLGTPESSMAQLTLDSVENDFIDHYISDLKGVVSDLKVGKDIPVIGLSYTFDERDDTSNIPRWAKQAIACMQRVNSH
jgi:glutamate/tyrosine decarboxylase-like PLP-dependent enzyme